MAMELRFRLSKINQENDEYGGSYVMDHEAGFNGEGLSRESDEK
jgi:hypothetical protein